MCHFLTIGANASLSSLRKVIGRAIQVFELNNPSLDALNNRGMRQFILIEGGCSCRMYSPPGDAESEDRDEVDRARKLRAKYRRKGWSDEKVARAIKESFSAQKEAPRFSGLRRDVTDLVAAISRDFGLIGMVVHQYKGSVEGEEIVILREQQMEVREFRGAHQLIPEDEIWWIHTGH